MKRVLVIFAIVAFAASNIYARIINIPADFSTIQAGINASANGDTVLVQPGIYYSVDFNGHRIVLASLFLINGDRSYINSTILDGLLGDHVISIASGEDSTAMVIGLTLRNGVSYQGGGIRCLNSSPLIKDDIIAGNWAWVDYGQWGQGGGIYCGNASPSIINCIITQNYAGYGTGIFCEGSSHTKIINCIFSAAHGPVIYATDSTMIINSIIWGNDTDSLIRGYPIIRYCLSDGQISGEGVIQGDPFFINPLTYNYNICSASPCIDAGDPDIFDPDGTRSDIGIFFAEHPTCPVYNKICTSTDGDDIAGNGSIESPYKTIQHALNMSLPRDSIFLGRGIYNEKPQIFLKSNSILSNYIYSNDSSDLLNTIIKGTNYGGGSTIVFHHCDSSTSIEGLTIDFDTAGYWLGGGISLAYANTKIKSNIITGSLGDDVEANPGIACGSSSPTIENNSIKNNYNGIICNRSTLEIHDNIISNNYGQGITYYAGCIVNVHNNIIQNNGGRGIITGATNTLIYKNIIDGNRAGGIYATALNPFIIGNLIINNSAYNGAGIVYNGYSSYIYNNIIINNIADTMGGGIWIRATDQIYAGNNVIYNNRAGVSGGGIDIANFNPVLTNNIIWENSAPTFGQLHILNSTPNITYCDIQGGYSGEGNINNNPLFLDPTNGDFRLKSIACGDSANSPCIDTGDPNILDSLLDCSWGLGTTRSDMGAYGGGDSILVGIDGHPITNIPLQYSLSQNYPNPFNPATTIKYSLPKSGYVTIDIFDILGRKVETLSDGQEQAGYHQVIWNAQDKSSGIYFYRIQSGDYTETKKMLLLK